MQIHFLRVFFRIIVTFSIVFVACNNEEEGDEETSEANDQNSSYEDSSSQIDFAKMTPSCFTASDHNPLIENDDFFTGSNWNDPSLLHMDNQYIMYASADTSFNGDIKIYRLVSDDGINFTLEPETPVLEKGAAGTWDDKSTETPSVVYFNNVYHMFYTGYQTNVSTDFKIGHATSLDGVNWTKENEPVLAPSGGPAVADDFDQFVTAEPGAVVFENKLFVYFTAQGYITTSGDVSVNDQLMTIGLMTSEDGESFSSPTRVYDPDQSIYPRHIDQASRNSGWHGHSTPSPIVLDGKVHLFLDTAFVTESSEWTQRTIHHAVSEDGQTNWTTQTTSIHKREDFLWTEAEIRAPATLLVGSDLKLYFAGHQELNLGIGLSSCKL